jgi:hypothetical protein
VVEVEKMVVEVLKEVEVDLKEDLRKVVEVLKGVVVEKLVVEVLKEVVVELMILELNVKGLIQISYLKDILLAIVEMRQVKEDQF